MTKTEQCLIAIFTVAMVSLAFCGAGMLAKYCEGGNLPELCGPSSPK